MSFGEFLINSNDFISSLGSYFIGILVSIVGLLFVFLFLLDKIAELPFVKGFLENFFDRLITFNHNKALEKYKSELNNLNSLFKFEIDKNLVDFKLYSSKKHEVYTQVYKQLLEAKSYTFDLVDEFKIIQSLTFEDYNVNDLIEYLKNNHVPEGQINNFVNEFEMVCNKESMKELARKIDNYLRSIIHIQKIENSFSDLRRQFYLNALFFPDKTYNELEKYIKKLSSLFYIGRYEKQPYKDEVQKEKTELIQYLFENLSIIRNQMKNDLSGSFDLK